MKSLKISSVGKALGNIRKKTAGSGTNAVVAHGMDAGGVPESVARNNVTAFCEAGGSIKGDEVLFLPPIVDAAESSPTAASECARYIRRFMGKDYNSRPSWQYNAIMLLRILADYPGPTFTKNIDDKFIDNATTLLKKSRDPSVRQLLMETLDDMEHHKMDDKNLAGLINMWKREKEKALKDYGGVPNANPLPIPNWRPPVNSQSRPRGGDQNYFARSHRNNALPDPVELASRLEEARTSAKLLEQVVLNTPYSDILNNELIKEFSDRCLSASRSIQGYMVCDNPAPDNDTMESLIDTNEQLQTALNQHQRSILSARKQLRSDDNTPVSDLESTRSNSVPSHKGKGKQSDDPFADPAPNGTGNGNGNGYGQDRLAFEPFNPGFSTSSGPQATGSSSIPRRPVGYDVSDEEDLYEASSRGKEPAKPARAF